MQLSDQQKECVETWGAFFDQFGKPDPYTKIVLEVFFEELYESRNQEDLSVPGASGQEGSGDLGDPSRTTRTT